MITIDQVHGGIVMAGDNAPKTRDGRKTQTRRVEKCLRELPPFLVEAEKTTLANGVVGFAIEGEGCLAPVFPKYQPGQILYVQEALERRSFEGFDYASYKSDLAPVELADFENRAEPRAWQRDDGTPWKPRVLSGRYMPKSAARTFIRITDVRCERLKDISIEDIIAEGLRIDLSPTLNVTANPKAKLRRQWRELWNKCNPKNPWQPEMWNFAYSYELVEVQQ